MCFKFHCINTMKRNSGDQKSALSVTRVLLPGVLQVVVPLVSLQLFLDSLFMGNPGRKRLAYVLRQWSHSSSFPSMKRKTGLAGTRKRSRVFPLTAASCLGKSKTAEQVGSNTLIYSGEYIPPVPSTEYISVLLLLPPKTEVISLCLISLPVLFLSFSSFLGNYAFCFNS